jgi:hypothetical protein
MGFGARPGSWIKDVTTKGAIAEIEHGNFNDAGLRNKEAALSTKETLERTKRELMIVVSCGVGAALLLLWLLLTWNP